ncbi:MAG: glycosyltransferase family 4 protein [Alphaproteobacteria bacterium]
MDAHSNIVPRADKVDMTGQTILQVIPALEAGGAERGCIDVAAAVVEAGGRAIVVSDGGRMERQLIRAGGEAVHLPVGAKNPLVMWRTIRQLKKLMVAENVSLIHARSRAPAWVAWRAAQETQTPFVTTWHGLHDANGKLKERYNGSLAKGDRVIAISEFIEERLTRIYGVGPDRLRMIHRGIDTQIFNPDAVPAARMMNVIGDWNLPDGVPVILLPGRLTRWKGQRQAIEAAAIVRDKLGEGRFILVMVGDDQGRTEYRAELEKLIKKNNLEGWVRLRGHVSDMPAAYKIADVVLCASEKAEAFGRVPVEGQAMGALVVATDHGGARETVVANETGFLVKPNDINAMAEGLIKALTLPEEERQRRAHQASDRVRDLYSVETMCLKTLNVYKELLD